MDVTPVIDRFLESAMKALLSDKLANSYSAEVDIFQFRE